MVQMNYLLVNEKNWIKGLKLFILIPILPSCNVIISNPPCNSVVSFISFKIFLAVKVCKRIFFININKLTELIWKNI